MIQLEALIELKLPNSSFSSSNFSIRAFPAYPLIEIKETVPCRTIRGKSSGSRQQYLSQQCPPPLLSKASTVSPRVRPPPRRRSWRRSRTNMGLLVCISGKSFGTPHIFKTPPSACPLNSAPFVPRKPPGQVLEALTQESRKPLQKEGIPYVHSEGQPFTLQKDSLTWFEHLFT